jgi:hypothetical protein
MTWSLYLRDFLRISIRDAAVVGYVLVREWTSVGALVYVIRHLPRLWKKRRVIQSRKRIEGPELDRWFYN